LVWESPTDSNLSKLDKKPAMAGFFVMVN